MAFRKVCELKEITLVYQSNGNSMLQLFTDMPGGLLTPRLGAGVTLPGTSNLRFTKTIPLDNIEAVEFYPQVTPQAGVQTRIFSGLVWYRPIGVYIDGSATPQAEIWNTAPITPGA